MQLSHEPAVFMGICSTETEQLSRKVGDMLERNAIYIITVVAVENSMKLTAERNVLLLRLEGCKASKQCYKRKLSEEEAIARPTIESVKQLEKMYLSQKENKLPKNTKEKLRKNAVSRRSWCEGGEKD